MSQLIGRNSPLPGISEPSEDGRSVDWAFVAPVGAGALVLVIIGCLILYKFLPRPLWPSSRRSDGAEESYRGLASYKRRSRAVAEQMYLQNAVETEQLDYLAAAGRDRFHPFALGDHLDLKPDALEPENGYDFQSEEVLSELIHQQELVTEVPAGAGSKKSGSKSHRCDVCGKCYTTVGNLNVHRKVHFGKPYRCEFCGKGFTRKATKDAHIERHLRPRRGAAAATSAPAPAPTPVVSGATPPVSCVPVVHDSTLDSAAAGVAPRVPSSSVAAPSSSFQTATSALSPSSSMLLSELISPSALGNAKVADLVASPVVGMPAALSPISLPSDEPGALFSGLGSRDDPPSQLESDFSLAVAPPAGERSGAPSDGRPTAVFPCPFPGCGLRFCNRTSVVKHQRVHASIRAYSCPACQKRFFTLAESQAHYAGCSTMARAAAAVPLANANLAAVPVGAGVGFSRQQSSSPSSSSPSSFSSSSSSSSFASPTHPEAYAQQPLIAAAPCAGSSVRFALPGTALTPDSQWSTACRDPLPASSSCTVPAAAPSADRCRGSSPSVRRSARLSSSPSTTGLVSRASQRQQQAQRQQQSILASPHRLPFGVQRRGERRKQPSELRVPLLPCEADIEAAGSKGLMNNPDMVASSSSPPDCHLSSFPDPLADPVGWWPAADTLSTADTASTAHSPSRSPERERGGCATSPVPTPSIFGHHTTFPSLFRQSPDDAPLVQGPSSAVGRSLSDASRISPTCSLDLEAGFDESGGDYRPPSRSHSYSVSSSALETAPWTLTSSGDSLPAVHLPYDLPLPPLYPFQHSAPDVSPPCELGKDDLSPVGEHELFRADWTAGGLDAPADARQSAIDGSAGSPQRLSPVEKHAPQPSLSFYSVLDTLDFDESSLFATDPDFVH